MRLDKVLVQQGLVASRNQAQKLIRDACVEVKRGGQWLCLDKVSEDCEPQADIRIKASSQTRYVSRAGLKLAGALEHLGLSPEGCIALDVGQSTGGFSDCLLQGGAQKVIGVDVGHGQLASSLVGHPRLVSLEGINARHLSREQLVPHHAQGRFDLVVMDVSFISQTLILPQLSDLLAPNGVLISLVKPQFELEPQAIGKGGIVKDARHFVVVETKIRKTIEALALEVMDYFQSPIDGTDGNREFFLVARAVR